MLIAINNRDDLLAALTQGATVITPNNRLSNQLVYDWLSQQSQVSEKPQCLPYSSFLRTSFKSAQHSQPAKTTPLLLTMQQQRYLWRQILGHCNDGLLREIQSAWTNCQHWLIDCNDPVFSQTPQTRQFQQWQWQMQQQLDKLNAITDEQLGQYLLRYPNIFNPKTIFWACFDDFTPEQRAFQKMLCARGCKQYQYELAQQPNTTHLYAAKDSQDEYLRMIEWLKHELNQGAKRIGVVVPHLENESQHLQRLLQRHIPADQLDISLGQALIEYPLIAHALEWLTLEPNPISHHQARLLLHSPYLGGSKTEFMARAEVIQEAKMLQEAMIPWEVMLTTFANNTPKLSTLLSGINAYPEKASPNQWITLFKTRLMTLGFPGDYSLSSSAYQCYQRFISLFDELLQLTVITQEMSKAQALTTFIDLAKTTVFQIKKTTTPIQILGLLEASGCTFDSIWICGVTDLCLPQKTNLSAFIPIDLQRTHKMPRALPARELQFAEQLLHRLQHSSNKTVLSYPCLTGDIPNLPSPLISHLPYLSAKEDSSIRTINLHEWSEEYRLPLMPNESVSGGTSLLANQAKCPFRAFAAHRLYAKPGSAVSIGPDASERGQIIHKIMDLLWRDWGNQTTLLSLTPENLNAHIENAITLALAPLLKTRSQSFSTLIHEVEVSRLHRLVTACLEWDKNRPPFVIEAVEQEFNIQLAGLDFRVRVDRLDKTSTDHKWVIDYKSSLPSNKPWNEERPEAPQLLLYALLDDSINTLLFLQLKAGRVTCSGLSNDETGISGVSSLKKDDSWTLRQQQWRKQLTELASEFAQGYCPPQPNRASTCQQCDFSSLCRIE